MGTLEGEFLKEFRQSVGNVGYKDIYKIKLPEEVNSWHVSETDLFMVKGIPENSPFASLNGENVRRLPRGTVAKRRRIDKVTRSYAKDEEGNFVYDEYPVPVGSIVVLSNKDLKISYRVYVKPPEGYGYIDFVRSNKDSKIEYMYVLPKTVLYKINETALALSVKNMKNYSGMGYTTWNNGVIYLHVIPYKPNSQYIGSKILCTKQSTDYAEEIKNILKFWQDNGIIPVLPLCRLEDGSNCALKPTMVGYEEYDPVDILAYGDKEVYGSESGNDEESGGIQ